MPALAGGLGRGVVVTHTIFTSPRGPRPACCKRDQAASCWCGELAGAALQGWAVCSGQSPLSPGLSPALLPRVSCPEMAGVPQTRTD